MKTVQKESTREAVNFLHNKYGRLYLKQKETAKELGISEETLFRMRKDGEINSSTIRGSVRIAITEVAKFV